MSGGGSQPAPQNVTQVSSSEPPAFVQPFSTGQGLEGALSGSDPRGFLPRAFELSERDFVPLPSGSERIQGFDPLEQQGINQIAAGAQAGSPEQAAIRNFALGQLGQTPGANPFVDQLVGTAQGDIVDQFNTTVAPSIATANQASGSFGNTGIAELEASKRFGLARALGDVENQIRVPAFFQDVQNQFAAAPLAFQTGEEGFTNAQRLLGAGGAQRQLSQSQADVDFQNLLQERDFPFRALDVLGAGLTTAGGGFGQTSTQSQQFLPQSPNPFLGALGASGQFAGGLGSLIGAFPQ